MADYPPLLDVQFTPEEMALARANALRRRPNVEQLRSLGLVGQLTGDKVLAPVGKSLLGTAQAIDEQAGTDRQHALARAIQAQQMASLAEERRTDNARADATLAETKTQNAWNRAHPTQIVAYGEGGQGMSVPGRRGLGGAQPIEGLVKPPSAGGAASSDKAKEQILSALGKDLDPYSGRANLTAQAQKASWAADRLETLLDSPGPMTSQRLEEAVIMAATVANGGNQPTEAQVKGMYPKTVRGDVAGFIQRISNNPQDIEAGPFIDLLRQQSVREKETAKKQIQKAFLSKLVHHPLAFQKYREEAERMAEAAGLKGLYDPQTLLPTQNIETVVGAGGDKRAAKQARIRQLISQGVKDPAVIQDALTKEGLGGG
jgi:hypothetical protein